MNELNQYGILSGNEIRQRMSKGDIIIHPYNDQQLGPNSYNLRLMDRMLVYTEAVLDPKRDNRTREIIIPPEGYVLKPGRVYIASTEEWTETRNLVPMLVGRSSVGRRVWGYRLSGSLDAGAGRHRASAYLSRHGNLSNLLPHNLWCDSRGIRRKIHRPRGGYPVPAVSGDGGRQWLNTSSERPC